MKKRTIALLGALFCAVLCIAALLSFSLAAESRTVYLDAAKGNDANDGLSASKPKQTLDGALKLFAGTDGKIILLSDYTVSGQYTEPNHGGDVTFSAQNGAKLIFSSSTYRMNGPMTFENIALVCRGTVVLAAQFCDLTFGEGVTVENGFASFFVNGGYETPTGNNLSSNRDSHITVKSGEFHAICGFTRNKGQQTMYYTGTAHLTVEGGRIYGLYGGPLYNHAGGSAEILVSGGEIANLYTGGDITRKLSGDAKVTLAGGSVGSLRINNVIGNAEVFFEGGQFNSVTVGYENDTLAAEAEKAGSKKTASYNVLLYSEAQIQAIENAFDEAENHTNIYLSTSSSHPDAVKTLDEALRLLALSGGEITVSGRVEVKGGEMPATASPVRIKGESGASLVFNGNETLTFSSPVEIDALEIAVKGSLTIQAESDFTAGKDLTVSGPLSLTLDGKAGSTLQINGGTFASLTLNAKEDFRAGLNGGKLSELSLGEGNAEAVVAVGNAEIENLTLAREGDGDVILQLFSGKVGKLKMTGCPGGSVFLGETEIGSLDLDGVTGEKTGRLLVGKKAGESESGAFAKVLGEGKACSLVFLADGGTGTGISPFEPVGSLGTAVNALGGEGSVVLCGDYTYAATQSSTNSWSGKVTVTSSDGYVNYGGKLILDASLRLGGSTALEDITVASSKSGITLYAMGNPLVIGDRVKTERLFGNTSYINLCGGRPDSATVNEISVRIGSGDWGTLRGGSENTGSVAVRGGNISLTIDGGVFHGPVTPAAYGFTNGSATLTVNGGTFYGGIYGFYSTSVVNYSLSWNLTLTLNDGTFYFQIAPAYLRDTSMGGTYTVNLNGGDYRHLTDLYGSEKYKGTMKSTLTVGDGVDVTKKEEGTLSFKNYIRVGADPWIFTCDGYYYLAGTGGILHKAANIDDLRYSTGYRVYNPQPGMPYSHKMWSPEIHYFSAEEIGEEYAGWYMFICCDDGKSEETRFLSAYVLKCLDGNDLLGRWGNPETGEVNVPAKMYSEDVPELNNTDDLFGGMSVIRIDGVPYITFVSEVGRGTADFYQTISITKMKTPWIMYGQPTVICKPQYDWEKGGYGYSALENKWWPMVVEGGTAVYGENGEVFLVFSGSGYWTTQYNLALLTYTGGDPLSSSSWVKSPRPFFSLSDSINGCGHASYFTDTDGTRWAAYHAYTGKDTSSGRFVFVEPIQVSENGISVGNGSGHPNDIDTLYTVGVNPMPLADKAEGFTSSNLPETPSGGEETTGPAESGSDETNLGAEKPNAGIMETVLIVLCGVVMAGAVAAVVVVAVKTKKH